MNENIGDEVLPPVFDDDNDVCSFEGWENEEIEALRIDQQARLKLEKSKVNRTVAHPTRARIFTFWGRVHQLPEMTLGV